MVNQAQISAIQDHWNGNVKPNMQAVGNNLFLKYFAANPEDKKFFKKFAGVADGDLTGNGDFCAQTLAVMKFMDKVVSELGGKATDMMAAQVGPHKARGVDASYLKKMWDFLPGFIGDNGGDAGAWKAAADAIKGAL